MERKQFLKQAIELQRSTIDTGFDAMSVVHEQTEKLTGAFIEQVNWIPEEGKRALAQWARMSKKGRDDFRKAVDEGFKRVGDCLDAFEKEGK